ncbi:MAG: GDP-mannose-dependent alpha-(1-6)-phosphatidylinositol monomannoside mannosyltransferase [Actinobacteria bacterium]|nr:GDP-mannose-dependent alpha-(1-6)-phosphatidylinositol monomannoside mannosyltransferase [Actinomycetota bacterium]
MQIAVFHNLPSGGAKRALYGLVKHLAKAGCNVDVFVPSTADEVFLPLRQLVENVTVLPVRKTPMGLVKSTVRYIVPYRISLADLEETQKRLASLINQSKYDVVFVEQDKYTMSPFILKYLDKPHVYYCQQPMRSSQAVLTQLSKSVDTVDSLVKKMGRRYITPRLERIDKENASFAKVILTNSYFSREAILTVYGMNSFVSYLGVDTEIFRPLKMECDPFVLSVGSITPAKGFDFIIEALSLVRKEIRPRFVIVGNVVWEPWKTHLETLAAQREVKLEINALIDDLELVKLYNRAKLVVYAPYLEPFGLVPLEAMACGTPVVAVKEGGVRESVVHNDSGILTERDEREFAEAINQLLLDENERQSMAQRGMEFIQSVWTLRHSGERLQGHLQRVMQRSSA